MAASVGSADREDGLEVGGTDGDASAVTVPVKGPSERREISGKRRLPRRVQCRERSKGWSVPASEEGNERLRRREPEGAGALDRPHVVGGAIEDVDEMRLSAPQKW